MQSSLSARRVLVVVTLGLAGAGRPARAQQPAPVPPSPEVGALAPDFTLAGATRFGPLRDHVRLSDFRGRTVVLAFFYRARTKG